MRFILALIKLLFRREYTEAKILENMRVSEKWIHERKGK